MYTKTYTINCPAEIYTIVQMDCVFDFFLVSIQSSNTNINDDLPKEDLTRYGKKKTNNIIIMLWNIKQFSLFIMFFLKNFGMFIFW